MKFDFSLLDYLREIQEQGYGFVKTDILKIFASLSRMVLQISKVQIPTKFFPGNHVIK